MKIACISASFVPSRTANSVQLMKVCDAMVGLDHQVRLWVPEGRERVGWAQLKSHYGISGDFAITYLKEDLRFRRYVYSARAVLQAIRWAPDLIYVWPVQAAVLSAWLGRMTLLELHDRPSGRLGPGLFRLFLHGRGCRRILPTTAALNDYLERLSGRSLLPPFSIVSPNGVDLGAYQELPDAAHARRELGWREQFTAGYTGHFYQGRGLELMLALARSNPAVSFVWAGGTQSGVEAWRARIDGEGLKNVSLLGFIPHEQIPLVQSACDVLLAPYGESIEVSSGGNSASFASPMKLIEYLAAGRPILCSDLPILEEVLTRDNACLLPVDDEVAWNAALGSLLSDAALRARLSKQARISSLEHSWHGRQEKALHGLVP